MMDNIGEATRRMPPTPHPLTQQNYYLCDVTNHVPDIPLSSSLAAYYASLSRSLPPQLSTVHRLHRHLHYLSSWSIVDVPADTLRSSPAQLSINRVPKPLSFPEQSCTLLGRRSAGTYEDPRNEYNKGRL